MNSYLLITAGILLSMTSYSQTVKFDSNKLEAVNVSMSIEMLKGKEVVKVIKDSSVKEYDEPTFVKIKGSNFKNGTIEVKVLSRLLKNAPDFARGFIGVAFRINDSNTKYESIYLRPVVPYFRPVIQLPYNNSSSSLPGKLNFFTNRNPIFSKRRIDFVLAAKVIAETSGIFNSSFA